MLLLDEYDRLISRGVPGHDVSSPLNGPILCSFSHFQDIEEILYNAQGSLLTGLAASIFQEQYGKGVGRGDIVVLFLQEIDGLSNSPTATGM